MTLSWLSVNANNGQIITDLPSLRPDGALKQTLMRYESQTVSLPAWDPLDETSAPPSNWVSATRPGAVFLVALGEPEENEPRGVPLWGGMVIRRSRVPGGGVKLSLVTAEGYMDRIYVGDHSYKGGGQNGIVQQLADIYLVTGARPALPLRVEQLGGSGTPRDRVYKDADDKTLYSVLTDLSGVLGGPEWTIRWEWVDETRLGLVLSVGSRIGSAPPAGLEPAAQFYLPGDVTECELVEGYGSDEGANDVVATSSGVEDARPQSPRQTNTADLRPRFEYRWTPSTSITEVSTLTSHAQRALAAMKDGSLALAITANREEAPKLGRDWRIGDDIGFSIEAPEFPGGLTGTARCVGWELTDTTVTPLVDVTNIEGVA